MISQVIDSCFDLNSELIDLQHKKAPIAKIGAANKFRYRVGELVRTFRAVRATDYLY
jgi:hypothetical protein